MCALLLCSSRHVRIQVLGWGKRDGRGFSAPDLAIKASLKNSIAERRESATSLHYTQQVCSLSKGGQSNENPRSQERLVTANRKSLSAWLLSGGTSGCSRKYHHWSALSRSERSNLPATHARFVHPLLQTLDLNSKQKPTFGRLSHLESLAK